MSDPVLERNNLVLYKQDAARVLEIGARRIVIKLPDGRQLRVRPKDVILLHRGPINSLPQLKADVEDFGELIVAWELLAGSETNLRELAELAYGEFTPEAAWTVWKMVDDGIYFSGLPEEITVNTAEYVQAEKEKREAREREQQQWDEFVQRVSDSTTIDSDDTYLRDVEALALGQHSESRVLGALGREQTQENAHDLLLQVGYWEPATNPYPARAGINLTPVTEAVPPLAYEPRRDLRHLPALAIDDEGNMDPDDAISWDDGRLWVHVADVAALVTPNSALDLAARERTANLYLPEETVSMLPAEVTKRLGLGLEAESPALSFGIDVAADGQIEDIEIMPSIVRVTRMTYEEAETLLADSVLARLCEITARYEKRRRESGAIEINLPEVRVRCEDGRVSIKPILPLQSRNIVREAMLMAGEAVAIFAQKSEIAIPYTTQDPPAAPLPEGDTMSAMFATRKLLKPGKQSLNPGPHSGLGMTQYAQVTSPLRRYLDLVIHQQLRAQLSGSSLLSEQEIVERIGATSAIGRDLRRTERISRQHWTLVYLLNNPEWQGQGVIVEARGRRFVTILPDLDLETDLYLPGDQDLDSTLTVKVQDINLAYLNSRFTRITSPQSP